MKTIYRQISEGKLTRMERNDLSALRWKAAAIRDNKSASKDDRHFANQVYEAAERELELRDVEDGVLLLAA